MKKEEIEAKANAYIIDIAEESERRPYTEQIRHAFTAGYQSALAEVERVREGGWVDVKDRLPEIEDEVLSDFVLVFLENHITLLGRLGNEGWSVLFRDGEYPTGKGNGVTHWHPLPPQP